MPCRYYYIVFAIAVKTFSALALVELQRWILACKTAKKLHFNNH